MSIQSAIDAVGATAIARGCGCGLQHVYNWQRRGIPAERVLTVAAATGWRVTPNALRPDIYPNPTDGLPPEVTAQQQEAA